MRTLIVMALTTVIALLLSLPGYCSDWWPVWGQAACLFLGVLGAAAEASLLVWMLEEGEED